MGVLLDEDFCRALPKAELHAHLTGSISRETLHGIWLRKLSKPECVELEDPLIAIQTGQNDFVDVQTFFPLFDKYIYSLCNDIESVKYATQKVLQDFEADGVRYVELRTTPRECIATGMTRAAYVEAVHDTLVTWNATNHGTLEAYLILSIDRKMTAEQAAKVVDLALLYKRAYHRPNAYVVGLDLCGNPAKGDVAIFTPAFRKAKDNGLGITVHFAEVPQSSTDRELEAILSWEPDRLGHCIYVPSKLKSIIESLEIGIELCLSCNVLGRLTSGGFSKHHLGEWITRKTPIALSTDDVGIFGSPLSQEYRIAAEYFLSTPSQAIKLCRSTVEVAFAGKARMLKLIDAFERDFNAKGAANGTAL